VKRVLRKPKNFRSLTVTLAVAFLALGAVVLLISSALNIHFSLQTQQDVIAQQQQLIAGEAADTVKDFIQEKFNMMDAAVSIGNIAVVNQEKQEAILETLLGLDPSFRQLFLLNGNEQELARVSRISHVSGTPIDHESPELFSQAEQGESGISSIYIDELTSEPMIVMAVPVTDIFGDFKGALMAEVNLKFMWDMVYNIKIGKTGIAYVVNKEGKLIAFGDISRVLSGDNLAHLDEVAEFMGGDELNHVSSADISEGIQGNLVVANHAHLGSPDWAVVVEMPVEEAYETIYVSIWLSMFTMLISFFLAIIAGLYLSRRITEPIIRLRDAAIRIGSGDMDTKIRVKTKDEVGELAAAFNQMADDLKKSRKKIEDYSKGLERKVEERTKKLRESEKRYKNLYETYMKILTKKYYKKGKDKKKS
jgi:methyl-accepting chemotaxis protein